MADTYTTYLNLTKPEIGASTDTWGTKQHANYEIMDALFTTGPYLTVAAGGTGGGSAATARSNLGLGTMATQNASAVNISGGTAILGYLCEVKDTSPRFRLWETDASTDSGRWTILATADSLYFQGESDDLASRFTWQKITRSAVAGNTADYLINLTVNGNVVYHAGNLSSASIAESQIANGTVFPRLASSETITGSWTFNTRPKVGQGGVIAYNSSSYTGGAVTVSTSTPSGTPAAGDQWIKYTP